MRLHQSSSPIPRTGYDAYNPFSTKHPDVDPFFKRSLQRYIDDQHLVVVDLSPGPLSSYAKVLFSDSVGAYSGPLHLCDGLGVKW